jgi:hypothetical protein
MPQFAATLSLADLDGTNGYKLYGTVDFGYAGVAVGSADINGDGFDDVIIGSVYGPDFVVFGGDTGLAGLDAYDTSTDGTIFLDTDAFDGVNGFAIDSDAGLFGVSLSGAGDVNGDDIDDFVIGGAGFQFIVFGTDGPIDPLYDDDDLGDILDNGGGYVVLGDFGGFGISSSAGDVNGDGFDDFIFGNPASPEGVAWVVFGGLTNLEALDAADGTEDGEIDVAEVDGTTGFAIHGAADALGFAVAAMGDVNGDGMNDLLVSDYSVGASFLVFGSATPAGADLDVNDLDGNNGYVFAAPVFGVGISISSAGDVNADGNTDFIIGVPFGPPDGGAFVLYGGEDKLASFDAEDGTIDGFIDLTEARPKYGFGFLGQNDGAAGLSVSSAGDVNGDGFDDILVGAPYASGYSGEAYVVFGTDGGFSNMFGAADLDGDNGFVITGEATDDVAGFDVSAGGDVNGDGFADIIVGAYYSYGGADAGGAAYIIYGHKPDEAVERTGTNIGNTIHGSDFNDEVKGLAGEDTLIGHDGNDRMSGGNHNDTLVGGEGADAMGGNRGADTFVYEEVSESTHNSYDRVRNIDLSVDKFDLWFTVVGVDDTVLSNYNHLEDNVDAAHLAADHAVLASNGTTTFLIVDANSTAGYQAGADLIVRLSDPTFLDLDTGDFI